MTENVNSKVIVAYIPVLHQGYKLFFEANPAFHNLLILDDAITSADRALQKDIRRLHPDLVRQSLSIWNIFDDITIGTQAKLRELNSHQTDVLMPDEDISRYVAKTYFPEANAVYHPVFLRWDRQRSNAIDPVSADYKTSQDELDSILMDNAFSESMKSSDIWRKVGALVAKDSQVIAQSHNQSRPTQHSSWMYSDPRNNFNKGTDIDKSVFIHAEAQLIGQAAREGISYNGCDMYVTTFPCPPCAMLIAESGIKRLFFKDGYAVLDGQNSLKSRGVEIIRVADVPRKTTGLRDITVPYPEK